MVEVLINTVRLFVIFVGSGLCTLVLYYFSLELIELIILNIVKRQEQKKADKLSIIKKSNVSPNSGFYELTFGNKKIIKIFSSPNGINPV